MKQLTIALVLIAVSQCAMAQVKEGREMDAIGKTAKAETILADKFPSGTRHEFVMVPMRDGVKLATDVFIPPGAGPWPVLFGHGFYGRLTSALDTRNAKDGTLVHICQDARGVYDSEGKATIRLQDPTAEIHDCADSLAWIAAQSWCNGKIGMTGASGTGVGPAAAFLSNNKHLVASLSTISTPWPYFYWGFHNGVRRSLYNWLPHAGLATPEWPKPTLPLYDFDRWPEVLAGAGKDNSTLLIMTGGWYDISPEAVLDVFAACARTCRIFATINPGGHGGHCPFTWPQKPKSAAIRSAPAIPDVLMGKQKIPDKSQLAYFLMGSFRDPDGPGNYYKVTDTWPVPHTPTPYYFHADGSLSTAKPVERDAALNYAYDPKNPAPTVGITYMLQSGPHDQRPLKDRQDILRFITGPLGAPLEITGKILADLYVSTDVPDTEFVVKLIDIHPDGYEMLIRESAIFGRSAEEFHGRPAPLEKAKVYQLKLDLRSTAIVLASGHRLGVLVTSSSKPEYEVHPNTFEPVLSYDKSPVAHQTIHLSAAHPSAIILPIIETGKQ